MGKLNFRETVFRGTIRELLEQGKPEIADSAQTLLDAHEWLRGQLREENNILPGRRFAQYQSRGRMHLFGGDGSSFMPTDNEPLAHFYQHWTRSGKIEQSIGRAATEGQVIASWRCDENPQPILTRRFRGVKPSCCDRGLKLAHITDAAQAIRTTDELDQQIAIRFLRTLSPLNVFLFPSGKCCEFRLISSCGNWKPKTLDWAEDLELRRVALGWVIEWMGHASVRCTFALWIALHRTKSRMAEDG
jgi:hypothetical protein